MGLYNLLSWYKWSVQAKVNVTPYYDEPSTRTSKWRAQQTWPVSPQTSLGTLINVYPEIHVVYPLTSTRRGPSRPSKVPHPGLTNPNNATQNAKSIPSNCLGKPNSVVVLVKTTDVNDSKNQVKLCRRCCSLV
mmetsp:Transcript_5227/g.7994  ORF Transcript_5227/g.7994 Transcript_5227/m.7994 type:complete len:133 (-) Transcript_5227:28-426(-)